MSKVALEVNVSQNATLTTASHTFLGDTRVPYVFRPPTGYDGFSSIEVNVQTYSNYNSNYVSILNSLPINISPNKSDFYVTSISDTLQDIPYTTQYTETTFGEVDTESEITKTVANMIPFKILNQYNDGDIIRSNGNYQIAFDNVPSEADSGYTLINKEVGCPVNRYRFRINVPTGTESLTVTENGIYNPTSPNIGFSTVNVNVPQSSKLNLKYISCVSGGQTTTGKADFNFSNNWNINNGSSDLSYTLSNGHTLIVYNIVNNNYNFQITGSNGSLTVNI